MPIMTGVGLINERVLINRSRYSIDSFAKGSTRQEQYIIVINIIVFSQS
jgi:hypothetical protein